MFLKFVYQNYGYKCGDLSEAFSFDKQKEYTPVSKDGTAKGNKIVYSFPPHSFTQIIVKVE
jgi:alpha-N-arabinofuranosidase